MFISIQKTIYHNDIFLYGSTANYSKENRVTLKRTIAKAQCKYLQIYRFLPMSMTQFVFLHYYASR